MAMDLELIYDTTEADFQAAVIDRSLDVPVLLDCWAPWCGPCRSLTPLLEKLVLAYAGRFVLAKLDTDKAPNIAAALQIRSIPHVVLIIAGRPVDQFQGALPESQIRAFLDRHLPEDMEGAAEAVPEVTPLDEAEGLIEAGEFDLAQELLDAMPAEARVERHATLMARLRLATDVPAGDEAALAARIATNPKDFDARHDLAAVLAHRAEWNGAFEQLLEVVLRDKEGAAREKARLQLVEWFALCPDAAAVSKGRRYLGMYLN